MLIFLLFFCLPVEKSRVVVLLEPFRVMGAWKKFGGTHQSGHTPRYWPEFKNGRSSAKGGVP